MATLVSQAVAEASTGRFSVFGDTIDASRQQRETPTGLQTIRARLQSDHMIRNSLYLILSYGIQAALGFAFWIVTTRLFSAADVGKASSLISATTLIAFAAVLGLNSTFVRYLPTSRNRDAMLTTGLLLVAGCGAVLSAGYVAVMPAVAPSLAFVTHHLALALGFVLLTAATAVNVLTDAVFIATRRAGYNALADGGFGSTTKVALSFCLVGTGAFGLYCASAGGLAVAAIASTILMLTALRWRPAVRGGLQALRSVIRFSAANYVGNVFDLLPSTAVSLIILDRLGAAAAAYYAVAFQVALILFTAIAAVGQTFLAEGSQLAPNWPQLFRRSSRLLILGCAPASLVLAATAHWDLLIFGARYSEHSAASLAMLSLSAIPLAANNWLWNVLRLFGRLRAIVWTSAVYMVAVCSVAWLLAPRGLTAVTVCWPIGGLIGAIAAAIPVVSIVRSRDRQDLRHDTTISSAPSVTARAAGHVR